MVKEINFEVIKSLDEFFYSEKFISLVLGPIGSTKTTAGIMKILHHAARMAPCDDGIRRSRCVWVRSTREQLRDTSIKDFLKWMPDPDLGRFYKTNYEFHLKVGDVECEVLFRGLDDQNDVRRLLSLQASFIVFDEFREIHPDIYNAAQGRVGRYPDKMMNGVGCKTDDGRTNAHLWGMSNPPDCDGFWEALITDPPANLHVTIQPSGLAPEADWTKFLPDDYYDNLAHGKTEDWIDVYIHAKFGKSLSGQPVFRSFDRDAHVAKGAVKPLYSQSPLLIGIDAGLTPAAVIGEQAYDGRLVVYDALMSEEMGALRFVREKLKPLLTNKFPGRSVLVVIDPAAFQRVQTDERTVADIYKSEGFVVRPARTNSIAARLAAVEKYLTRVVDGKHGLVVDPESGLPLVQALAGKYRYKINSKGIKDEKPDKLHPWSDLCFVAGTEVDTPGGPRAIEELRAGDEVCVPDGTDTVTHTGAHDAEELVRLEFSDGTTLTCTPDHPFYVKSHSCFLRADALTYDHTMETVEDGVWAGGANHTPGKTGQSACARSAMGSSRYHVGSWLRAKESTALSRATGLLRGPLTALRWTGFGSPAPETTSTTGTKGRTGPRYPYTGTSGRRLTDLLRKAATYTTRTTTRPTTSFPTWGFSQRPTTPGCTCSNGSKTAHSIGMPHFARPGWPQPSGTSRPKVGRNTESVLRKALGPVRWVSTVARRAEAAIFGRSGGTNATTAPLRVIKRSFVGSGRVYNLTTQRTHLYYAGGKLVHNCDAFQYMCLHADGGEVFGATLESERREVRKISAVGWT